MSVKTIWSIVLAVALLAGGAFFVHGPGEARAADAGRQPAATIKDRSVQDSTRKVTPVPVSARRVRAPERQLVFPIQVSTWLNGRTMRRDAMLALSFHVTEALTADPRFQVILLRGRARTVMATLPAPRRIGTGRTFESQWRIPAGFATGNDFFFKVVHTPTRKKGFGGLFTIR